MDIFSVELHNGQQIEVYRSVCNLLDSNMYVIIRGEEALIIDSCKDFSLIELFKRKNIKKSYILLTHEHYDHTSAVCWLQEMFHSQIICNRFCAERIAIARRNIPKLVSFVLANKDREDGGTRYPEFKKQFKPFSLRADIIYDAPCEFNLLGLHFKAYLTPGHSPGSWCLIVNDSFVITGDTLIQNTPVLERFKESSPDDLRSITLPFLRKLDENLFVLPGHFDPFMMRDNNILHTYK